jgi:hypothetical protein
VRNTATTLRPRPPARDGAGYRKPIGFFCDRFISVAR